MAFMVDHGGGAGAPPPPEDGPIAGTAMGQTPPWQWGGGPQPVAAAPGATGEQLIRSWVEAGATAVGYGDAGEYAGYVAEHRATLAQAAYFLDASELDATALSALRLGDPSAAIGDPVATFGTHYAGPGDASLATAIYEARLARPFVEAYAATLPAGTKVELVATEGAPRDLDGNSVPGRLAFEVTPAHGEPYHVVVNAERLADPGDATAIWEPMLRTLESDPQLLAAWVAEVWPGASQSADDLRHILEVAMNDGQAAFLWDGVLALPRDQQVAFVQGLAADGEFQAAFGGLAPAASGRQSALLLAQPVADHDALVRADVTARLAGGAAPVATGFNASAVDGVGPGAVLQPLGSAVTPERLAATLEAYAATDPPETIDELEQRLHDDGLIDSQAVATADGRAWLSAAFNLVRPYPALTLDGTLNFSLADRRYESLAYDPETNAVLVDTTYELLLGGAAGEEQFAAEERLALVRDLPLRIAIPLPQLDDPYLRTAAAWQHPTLAQLALLDAELARNPQVNVLQHGYRSDQTVWPPEWMTAGGGIGIAFSAMGADRNLFAGSGNVPYTPRLLGFDLMTRLDGLGLYGADRELNFIGHSFGGAAALEAAAAFDRLAEAGAALPGMRFVALEPAPSRDAVPFLTQFPNSALISTQNSLGRGGLEWLAYSINAGFIGRGAVDGLMGSAPEWLRARTASFPERAGFHQLSATAWGLLNQNEWSPQAVEGLLERNAVFVALGSNDEIVSSAAVRELFGAGNVREYAGSHYAHLEDPQALADLAAWLHATPAR